MRTPAGTSRPERLAIESAAHEAHNRAQEMTTAPARPMRGLAAKVRAILPWEHQIEEGLALSTVGDFLAMEGARS